MNPLNSDLVHRINIVGERNEYIEFNVCGSIFKTCKGLSHTSACYTKDGVERIFGKLKIMHYTCKKMMQQSINYRDWFRIIFD